MALLPYPRPQIIVRVANRELGDTRIAQLATFCGFHHVQAPNSVGSVLIEVVVAMFSLAGTEPGEPLLGEGFSSRIVHLVGDNLTLVDAATGALLATRASSESDEAWQAIVDGFSQDTMLQGDFFLALRENGLPGTISEMIRQNIQQADGMGRFA